jgi:hypothetical protein
MSMNTRNLPILAWMAAIGAGTVLIIGAFARFDPASSAASPATSIRDDPPAEMKSTLAVPAHFSPGLSEIVKLAQAHVDEGVMLAYVTNSGRVFSPTADEILYLSDLGLSQDVLSAIVKTAPAAPVPPTSQVAVASPTPLPPPTEPPPAAAAIQPDTPTPTANVFYNDLAPYGAWTQQPDYGLVWQPTVETIDPNWTPYVDAGQWMYSDCGWYWQSDYTWGWAAFHYGRWTNIPHRGWVWVPGNQWGPAWVAWRSTDTYIGWAPLPPGVSLNVLAQLNYNSKPIVPNASLGLPPSVYTFVSTSNLTSRNLPRRVLPIARAQELARNSVLLNNYTFVNNRIFNTGISRDAVAAAAHKPVPEIALRSVSSPDAAGLAMDRKTLAVYVSPALAASASASPSAQSSKNQPRVQAETPYVSPEEPVMLAENKLASGEIAPSAANSGEVSMPLPSLHYTPPAGSAPIHHHIPNVIIASGAGALPPNRDWPPGYGRTAVERPSSLAPAPRYDGFRPSPIQAESPHIAVENRPAPTEIRAAPVEPVHAAPAPAAASSSGSPKSK